MSFIRRQVGLRTDAASATGSLHAKVAAIKNTLYYGTVPKQSIASNNIRFSHDTEIQYPVPLTYTKLRAVKVNFNGTIRISYDMKEVDVGAIGAIGYTNIFKNNVAVGTERTTTEVYSTYTQDFSVAAGDEIGVYGKEHADNNTDISIRNFRAGFDFIEDNAYGIFISQE